MAKKIKKPSTKAKTDNTRVKKVVARKIDTRTAVQKVKDSRTKKQTAFMESVNFDSKIHKAKVKDYNKLRTKKKTQKQGIDFLNSLK